MHTIAGKRFAVKTHSGLFIYDIDKPIDPALIKLEDIAFGLSNICRYTGQVPFFSVGGHSLLVSDWIERRGGTPIEALWGLCHDAAEAYLGDIISPVKVFIPNYIQLESNFMKAITKSLGLPPSQPPIVTLADYEILQLELKHLFQPKPCFPWLHKHPEAAFLARFHALRGCLQTEKFYANLNTHELTKHEKQEIKEHEKGFKVRRRKTAARSAAKKRANRSRKGS